MFRRQTRPAPGRRGEWERFASELELVPGDDLAGRLPDQLGLGSGEIDPVYALVRPGQPRLVVFDQARERVGPTGRVAGLRTCVLVRAEAGVEFVSLRVTERQGKAMEKIEAGRTGSFRVEGTGDSEFEERLGVYARDEVGARRLLSRPVRETLLRLLCDRPKAEDEDDRPPRGRVAPVAVVGGRNLLITLEEPGPVSFDRLEAATVDALALYAALIAANGEVRPGGTGGRT